MARAVTFDPSDQRLRRRRARITQGQIAAYLDISVSTVSEYETGKKDALPWGLTPEDYERALDTLLKKRPAPPAADIKRAKGKGWASAVGPA